MESKSCFPGEPFGHARDRDTSDRLWEKALLLPLFCKRQKVDSLSDYLSQILVYLCPNFFSTMISKIWGVFADKKKKKRKHGMNKISHCR